MFGFIKQLWWFIKKNWYMYVLIVLVGLLQIAVNLLPAQIIADICKAIENKELTKSYLIYNIVISYAVIIVLIYIIASTKRVLQNRLKVRLYYALQVRYMENILIQDAAFFEEFQSGDLLTRALGDVKSVNFSGGNRLLNIFLESTTVIASIVVMILINPKLTLFSVLPLPIIFIMNMLLRSVVKKNWRLVREESSLMGNVVLESITNVRTIRAYSKEEENYQKNLIYSNRVYQIEKKNLKINVIFQPLFQSIVAVSTLIAYGLGSKMILNGELDISSLVKFVLYLNMCSQPLTTIGNMIMNFHQSLISLDRLNDVFFAKPKVVDKVGALDVDDISKIEYRNFSFRYDGDNNDTLKNINLVIKEGQTIGIVGHTGSGKSTLIRQLVRQLPIKENTLFINDLPIEDFKKEEIRRNISYVPQEHIMFSRSVYKNVLIGSTKEVSEEDVDKAIIQADFMKDIPYLPEGLDTIVGEYGVTLSGGQKQRLAIARAFLKDSKVLILDDSLSAVDGTTEANILKSLKLNRKGKTNIIVAHRLSAVMDADFIIVLDNGTIVESGNHMELIKKKGWYYEQFISQQMDNKEVDYEQKA